MTIAIELKIENSTLNQTNQIETLMRLIADELRAQEPILFNYIYNCGYKQGEMDTNYDMHCDCCQQ